MSTRQEEIRKILEMSQKGTITPEQAAELIDALPPSSGGSSRDEHARRDGFGQWIGRFFQESFGGAAGGTGADKWSGMFGHDSQNNAMNMSHSDRPEGSDFVYSGNELNMSSLKRLRIERGEFTSNALNMSSASEMSITQGSMRNSEINASSIKEISIDHATVSRLKLDASSFKELDIQGDSEIDGFKAQGCAVKEMQIAGTSKLRSCHLKASQWSEIKVQGSVLEDIESEAAQFSEISVQNSRIHRLLVRAFRIREARFEGCELKEITFSAQDRWRKQGVTRTRFENCKLSQVSFTDCRLENVTFKNIEATGLRIIGLELRDTTIDGNAALEQLLKTR